MGGEWKLVPLEPTPEMIGAAGLAMFKSDLATAMDPRAGFIASWEAALAASPAPPSGSAWGVKGLVWSKGFAVSTDDDGGPMEGIPYRLHKWTAGPYTIVRQRGKDGRFILSGKSDGIGLVTPTLDEVKAAAQRDYEARSALTPSPSYAEGIEAAAKLVTDRRSNGLSTDLRSIAYAIRELAGRPPAEDGWLDISTAPKDGTAVDLWARGRRPDSYFEDGEWLDDQNYSPNVVRAPTHWMPLPAPPNVKVAP